MPPRQCFHNQVVPTRLSHQSRQWEQQFDKTQHFARCNLHAKQTQWEPIAHHSSSLRLLEKVVPRRCQSATATLSGQLAKSNTDGTYIQSQSAPIIRHAIGSTIECNNFRELNAPTLTKQKSGYILPLHSSDEKSRSTLLILTALLVMLLGVTFSMTREVVLSNTDSAQVMIEKEMRMLRQVRKNAEQLERAGDFGRSEQLYRSAHEIARKLHVKQFEISTSLDVASVLHAQGNYPEAEAIYATQVLPYLASDTTLAAPLETEVLQSVYLLYEATGQQDLAASAKSEIQSRVSCANKAYAVFDAR